MTHSSETPISHGLEGVSSEDRIRLSEIEYYRLKKLMPHLGYRRLFLEVSLRYELTASEEYYLKKSISEKQQPKPKVEISILARIKQAIRDTFSEDE